MTRVFQSPAAMLAIATFVFVAYQNFSSIDLSDSTDSIEPAEAASASPDLELRQTFLVALPSPLGLSPIKQNVLQQKIKVFPGDVLIIRSSMSATEDAYNVDDDVMAELTCQSNLAGSTVKAASEERQKNAVRYGNHHLQFSIDGFCSASSGATEETVSLAMWATSKTMEVGGDGKAASGVGGETYLFVEQYSVASKSFTGQSVVPGGLAADVGSGTVNFGIGPSNIAVPTKVAGLSLSNLQTTDSVYVAASAAAQWYASPDDMYGMEVCGGGDCGGSGVHRLSVACENVMSNLKIVSQDSVSWVKPNASNYALSLEVYGANGTGLTSLSSQSGMQSLIFRDAAKNPTGLPLTSNVRIRTTPDTNLVNGQAIKFDKSILDISDHAILRAVAAVQLISKIPSSGLSVLTTCELVPEVLDSKGRSIASAVPFVRSFEIPYRRNPMRKEWMFNLPKGSYTVQGSLECTGNFSTGQVYMHGSMSELQYNLYGD